MESIKGNEMESIKGNEKESVRENVKKSVKEIKIVKNSKISPLSYKRIYNNVSQSELLKFFVSKEDKIIGDYIKKLKFKTSNKPVYAVKKYGDRYEFEVYFYRYNPDRESPIRITLDSMKKFPSIKELDKFNPSVRKCKLFKSDFIICSYDINMESICNGTSECNFYYDVPGGNMVTNFPYYILEESKVGKIVKTNEYGLIRDIMPKDIQKRYMVNKFTNGDEIIFFAKKPLKSTECVYIEGMNYNNFIKFIKYFDYSDEFVKFCRKVYNNSYKFCVSYDLNSSKQIIKTTIFGMFV
jgi:hypothetical protein